jgi:hypothetical protein
VYIATTDIRQPVVHIRCGALIAKFVVIGVPSQSDIEKGALKPPDRALHVFDRSKRHFSILGTPASAEAEVGF